MSKSPLKIKAVQPTEAIAAAVARTTVLPDVYYGQMQGVERAEAFSVAGIASADQLQQVLDSLNAALGGGTTFDAWKTELLEAPDVLALPRHRLDNIFRTNIQGAYARGKCRSIAEHADSRPFLRYSAINDSRTRPAHLAMDGHVAAVDDPIWSTWMAPNGYRCRCSMTSLTADQAERYAKRDKARLERSEAASASRQEAIASGPDKGWDYTPCSGTQPDIAAAKAPKYDPILAEKARAQAKQARILADSADPDKWVKVGEAQGSNTGGLYQAADGSKWYVKQYADPDQARTELATNAINRLIGIDVPDGKLIVMDGRTAIANAWRDDLRRASLTELHKPKHKVELRRAYQAAALTKNWDVVGTGIDNLVINGKGKLTIVDSGGSMAFRAQGGLKPYLAGPIDELDTLLNPSLNRYSAQVFGKYTKDELLVGLKNNLSDITKTKLTTIFTEAGFTAPKIKELTEVTWARTKWLRGLAEPAKATAKRTPGPGSYTGPVQIFREAQGVTPEQAFKAARKLDSRRALRGFNKARDLGFSEKMSRDAGTLTVYTGGMYTSINEQLREIIAMSDSVRDYRAGSHAAMSRLPKYSGATTRGLTLSNFEQERWLREMKKAHEDGKAIAFKSFVSSDTKGGWDRNTKIHIEAKGYQGVDVDLYSAHQGEKEILYPPDARFIFQKAQFEDDGKLHVYLIEEESAFGLDPVRFSMPD